MGIKNAGFHYIRIHLKFKMNTSTFSIFQRWSTLSALLLIATMQLSAQADVGVVWMGFEHQWTYNHRLNRLGDYIEQPHFEGYDHPVKHYHTGATGVGWDDGFFSSYYNVVKSDDVGFQAGKVSFELFNREGATSKKQRILRIPLKEKLQSKEQIVAVLNGFDLVAIDGADKLKTLGIALGTPIYNEAESSVDITVDVNFNANCGSFECNRFNHKYRYEIEVHYLLIAGNQQEFSRTEKSFAKEYVWDRKSSFEDGLIDVEVNGQPNYDEATMGFKSIQIDMDRDHWLVDWHTAIHPQFYYPKSGRMTFAIDLFLKQWKKKNHSPYKFASRFSKRKDGWAKVQGEVVLLQFDDACVENKSRSGAISWKGRNQSANSSDAVNVKRFRVKKGCVE